jgi:predicted RNase H-like nuclease
VTQVAVLGIDAAWTETQGSGVALVVGVADQWDLVAVTGSYEEFKGLVPGTDSIIEAAAAIAHVRPSLIAVDMPLSHEPITCRREADDAVSREYGSRWCGTHTPNPKRPGAVGRRLQSLLAEADYGLATTAIKRFCTIEVYPHPALLILTGAAKRLPYKVQRRNDYWPTESASERRRRLIEVWRVILDNLECRIAGVINALPLPSPETPIALLKHYEDRLDAVICAWVGIEALAGRAKPFGDETASIWIPQPNSD